MDAAGSALPLNDKRWRNEQWTSREFQFGVHEVIHGAVYVELPQSYICFSHPSSSSTVLQSVPSKIRE